MSKHGAGVGPALHLHLLAGGLSALAALVAAAGCEDSSTGVALQLNLDRPVDVAFTCYGGLRVTDGRPTGQVSDAVIESAQPLASCDLRAQPRPDADPVQPLPGGQEDLTAAGGAALSAASYFGLILQSGPGTVALAQFPAVRAAAYDGTDVTILDADPLTPGKNSISVGLQPVAIATDKTGCFAITANAGSCDLSSLDVNSALQLDGQAAVSRLAVKNGMGVELLARPAAIAMQPGPLFNELGAITAEPGNEIGRTCGAKPSGLAYVAYPSCNLVAAVDLSTGVISHGITFDAAGAATIVAGTAVTCSAEVSCGGAMARSPGPAQLDLRRDLRLEANGTVLLDRRRLLIGSQSSRRLTVVELGADWKPQSQFQVTLAKDFRDKPAEDTLGVLDVSLSPQLGLGGKAGKVEDRVGPQAQFAYAVATDGSVRVAEVLNVLKECDTQVDPRTLVAETSVARLGCLPVGDPLTPARRPGATGPGIVLPGDGIPSAVNIVRIDALPQEMRTASPTKLIGVFGVVTSTNGGTFVVDIDDDDKADVEDAAAPLSIDLATTLPHQLRDQVSDRGAEPKVTTDTGTVNFLCNSTGPGIDAGGGLSGGARLAGAVNLLTLPEVIADVKRAIMPTMQHLLCTGSDATVPVPELSFAAPPEIRESRFPDTQRLKSVEDWRLVWEGSLSGDNLLSDINGPTIRSGTLSVAGGALKMIDRSRPFCAAGVESYDLVQLRGCDPQAPTAQCPLGTKCYVHPDTTTGAGSCLPEKTADQLAETCRDFLVSLRRYTVSEAKTGELTLLPRQRVLRSTPLGGCRTVDDCNTLARDEAKLIDEAHPSQSTATARYAYACEADPSRKDSATIKRCVMTCTRDADCESGSVCGDTNRCMEGVTPPAACVQSVQRYELRAGEAFTVLGTQSGYIHPVIKDPGSERCIVPDAANRNPLQIGRIPLTAPACGSAGDPNPCLTEVGHVEDAPLYQPGTCDVATPANALRHRDGVTGGPHGVLAKTPAIRFRGPGMTFHLVDPYYPGDVCRGDRKGPWRSDNSQTDRPAIPTAFTGFALTFRQGGGYAPLGLRTSSTVPVKVVRGPQQSIWIVDEGDYLSESSSLPSTRGKVFRIEGASINTVNVMQ